MPVSVDPCCYFDSCRSISCWPGLTTWNQLTIPFAGIDVAGIPAINDLNTSPPSDTKVDWNSDFVTEYTDASGQTHPL